MGYLPLVDVLRQDVEQFHHPREQRIMTNAKSDAASQLASVLDCWYSSVESIIFWFPPRRSVWCMR
jgi:hypothetical protein